MSMFEAKYLKIEATRNRIRYVKGRNRYLPLGETSAELDDPGAVRRGYTLTTGLIGHNRDVGVLYLTLTSENDGTITLEIPRKYGAEARTAVAKINKVRSQS